MSLFKRVTSLVVASVLSVGLMIPAAFAAKLPDDVKGTKYEESVALLQALEVMVGDEESGDFRLEDNIRRSEVAKIAVLIAGLEDVAESSKGSTPFPDVVPNHWAEGYINVAVAQKFVIGDDWGYFRPDDNISFAEAATIFSRVLGYEPSAEINGGFPMGYLTVAGQIGLLKGGISTNADTKTLRGTVAMLAYNALTINLMERTGIGTTGEQYEIVDKTLLEDKLEVTKLYGQLIANSESTLTGPSNLKQDDVQIKVGNDVDTYKVNGTDAKQYLARNIVFYVKTSEFTDDKELVLVREDTAKNNTIKISATYVDDVQGEEGTARKLTYWLDKKADKRPQTATLASDVKVFYNGVATADYDLADLKDLASGSITLLDTTRSDQYNYVFVTEYQNMVVEDVSPASFRVNDKYNQMSLTLDPADKTIQFTLTKDGQAITLSDLNEWDVLSVAMDKPLAKDSKVFNVYVSSERVTGKVTQIDGDKYTIAGEEYEVANNYKTAEQPELSLNDEGTFYLDFEGRIAAVDTATRAGSNYAYVVAADITGSINPRLEMQMFNKAGETVIVKGAEKIKVNGTSGLKAEAALAAIEAANGGEIAQLITYEVNSNGEIYYVNTATVNSRPGSALKNKFSLDFAGEDVLYSATSKKLDRFNVTKDTIVFDIPAGSTDTDDYAVRTMDMFVDKSKYDIEIYDLSDDLTAKIVIVKNSKSEVNAEATIAVVERIVDVQNSDQINTHMLYAIQDGKQVNLYAKDTTVLVKNENEQLQAGDIIQFQTNVRGEIDKVTVLFDSNDHDNDAIEQYKAYEGTEMATVIGTVTKKFATSINVVSSNMAETNFNISNAKVYSYDHTKVKGAQVNIVDASHITKYDEADGYKVFMRLFKGEVTEIVLIKE